MLNKAQSCKHANVTNLYFKCKLRMHAIEEKKLKVRTMKNNTVSFKILFGTQ